MSQPLSDAQRRYQSMTEYERMAYSAANRERQQGYQRRTLDADPINAGLPFTSEEDHLLVWSPKRTVDLALELRRTYNQTHHRRVNLRRALSEQARSYIKVEDAPEDKTPTLCACATFDEDHESWCPNA